MIEAFEREGLCSFAVYEPETGNELNMLLANKIEDILPHELRYINGIPKLYYHLEGRQQIRDVYDKTKLGYGEMTALIEGVCKVLDTVKKYLLSYDDLLLDEQHIYYNWEKDGVEFAYLPGYGIPVKEQLTALVEYMLKNVDYQDTSGANLVYQLYEGVQKQGVSVELLRRYCSREACRPTLFEPRLDINHTDAAGAESPDTKKETKDCQQDLYVQENVIRQLARRLKAGWQNRHCHKKMESRNDSLTSEGKIPEMPVIENDAQHENVHLLDNIQDRPLKSRENDSATTLLTEQCKGLCLRAVNGDFPMMMPADRIIVGRQENACDYVLDVKEISRIHASLTWSQGEVTVTDLNSSNGTYVNQCRLGIHECVVLNRGDEVRFGSVAFLTV